MTDDERQLADWDTDGGAQPRDADDEPKRLAEGTHGLFGLRIVTVRR